MLEIKVPPSKFFDDERERFIKVAGGTLQLEHSLISVSKWEAVWNVHFLNNKNITDEQMVDYVRCMIVNRPADPQLYKYLSKENLEEVAKYLSAPMTATTFREFGKKAPDRSIITSEQIYSWMVAYGIPFECQKWHIKRLLTLIRVCQANNEPEKKMSRAELAAYNRELNAKRRAQYGTTG